MKWVIIFWALWKKKKSKKRFVPFLETDPDNPVFPGYYNQIEYFIGFCLVYTARFYIVIQRNNILLFIIFNISISFTTTINNTLYINLYYQRLAGHLWWGPDSEFDSHGILVLLKHDEVLGIFGMKLEDFDASNT